MKRLALAILMAIGSMAAAQTEIGKWNDWLDYSTVFHITASSNRIYAAARGGLFCIDLSDNTMQAYSKSSGLNDVGIARIAYDETADNLVVAYNNSNIDIIHAGQTYNLSDLKRNDQMPDKSINSIKFSNGLAYLSCGFGVVVIDLARREVKETLMLGDNGAFLPVYDMAFTHDSIFAATADGLKQIASTARHLGVSEYWEGNHRFDDLVFTKLDTLAGKLIVAGYPSDPSNTCILAYAGGQTDTLAQGDLLNIQCRKGLMAATFPDRVLFFDHSLNLTKSHEGVTCLDACPDKDGSIWGGHSWGGVLRLSDGEPRFYGFPQGPLNGDKVYSLRPFNYNMMLCPGGHDIIYTNMWNAPNLYTVRGKTWSSLDLSNQALDGAHDLIDAIVNPYDTTETLAALWGNGVASIRDGRVEALYNNATTGGALTGLDEGGTESLRTGALAFDNEGNLWALTALSTHPLAKRDANGQWTGYDLTSLIGTPEVDRLIFDSINNYLWFMGRNNEIYVHDRHNRLAIVNPNHGSKMSTLSVTAIAQDHSGNIWIGTNKGLKVIYDGYKAFQNGGAGEEAPVNCANITITNNEFAEYLMAYESVTSIAVDGANRKWVGTAAGGLYLISANGLDQLEHFTAANSPLFSDKISTLAIQPRTGEVFIGTDHGLQVYRGTATYATAQPADDIKAFPNPVRPDYDGPIAINGFTRNAIVHITDASGHTLFSTTAHGGQAIWNGRTLSGERVASGVYYVFASDATGGNRSVAKILVVR